jgi:hypothetical protein
MMFLTVDLLFRLGHLNLRKFKKGVPFSQRLPTKNFMVTESFICEKSWNKFELVFQMSNLPPDDSGDLKQWPPEGVRAASEQRGLIQEEAV